MAGASAQCTRRQPARLIGGPSNASDGDISVWFSRGHGQSRRRAVQLFFATSYAGIIAFMAVATEGSFVRAGERLGIGRSAVSRSVQKLEEQLSTRLFLRTTRTTNLTREGERFFENCNLGVTQIVGAMNDMLDLRNGPPRGMLRVCSTVGFGRKRWRRCCSSSPRPTPRSRWISLLDDRPANFAADQVDVAFRDGYIEDSSIIAKQLIPMQMVVCAAPAYVQKRGLPATLDELGQHDCINQRFTGRARGRVGIQGGRPVAQGTADRPADLQRCRPRAPGRARWPGIAQMPAHQVVRLPRARGTGHGPAPACAERPGPLHQLPVPPAPAHRASGCSSIS